MHMQEDILAGAISADACNVLRRIYPSETMCAVPRQRATLVFLVDELAKAMRRAEVSSWAQLGKEAQLPRNTIDKIKGGQAVTAETALKAIRPLQCAIEDVTRRSSEKVPTLAQSTNADSLSSTGDSQHSLKEAPLLTQAQLIGQVVSTLYSLRGVHRERYRRELLAHVNTVGQEGGASRRRRKASP